MKYEDIIKFLEGERRERIIYILAFLLAFVLVVGTLHNSEEITDEKVIISETEENR